jgi:Uncharacterized protein conserved in bacteria (DUF2188)
MGRKNQYVIRHPEGWAVKGEGNSRATRVFDRQWEAINFGIEVVKNQRSILIILNRKGVERDRKDYRDYQPPSYYYRPSYNWLGSTNYTPQPLNPVLVVEPSALTVPQSVGQDVGQDGSQDPLGGEETLDQEASALYSLQSELN